MKKLKRDCIVVFCLACVLALSAACSKQENDLGGDYNGATTRVPINLRSEGGTLSTNEKQIRSIRLLFFTPDGKRISNWLYNIQPSDNPSIMTGEMGIGMNNLYVVCNETPELGRDLAEVTHPDQIAAIRFTPPIDGITDPVPMFCHLPEVHIERGSGKSVKVTVNGETKSYLGATVTRIAARIGMTVIKNIPANEINFSISKLSYRICRVPAYSMLSEEGERYPQGAGWGKEIKVAGVGTIAASSNGEYQVSGGIVSTNPTTLDAIQCPPVYMPEHKPLKPENPNYCTYLLIEADCVIENSLSPVRSVYRINMGKLPATDHSIERNVNYQVYVKITGLGATGFYAEIVPVEEYDLPITWKPSEGYAIVGERREDYGVNTNIWNSYSQYSGILKVVKGKAYSNVCFRYGSIIALSDTTKAEAFNPSTDICWMPDATKTNITITSWNDVAHMTVAENVSTTTHTLKNIKRGKGDPCRLVGLTESEISAGTIDNKLWRLPTQSEMQWLIDARNETADVRGHYSFSTLLTPFNGYRTEAGVMVPSDNTFGHYWSATAAQSFSIDKTKEPAIATDLPEKAYSVRCLRTDIPKSIFNVGSFETSHLGGSGDITLTYNNIITPFWRMEIADSVSASQITMAKTEGSSKEPNTVTVKPLPNAYQTGIYRVNVTGYGLDGRKHQQVATIIQKSLHHWVKIDWTSVPQLQQSEGYYRIPVSGAKLSFTMQITPEPLPPFIPNFDEKLWRIRCKYYTDQLNIVYGSEAKLGEASVITIPENTRTHILGLEFDMVPVTTPYPPHTSEATVIIQDTN